MSKVTHPIANEPVERITRSEVAAGCDLEQIWMRQGISVGLRDLLWDWAVVVNSEFNRIAPGQQFSEVAKRPDTWVKVRAADYPSPSRDIAEVRPA
jgi:hypothetical protein